jgi:hypothetical protein
MIRDSIEGFGIKLKSYREGACSVTCPRCSANRKPAHQKEPCLYIKITAEGFGVRCFNCGWTAGAKSSTRASASTSQLSSNRANGAHGRYLRRDLAATIWREGRDPVGTMVERYLASRKLTLPPDPGEVLRFHPACPFKDKKAPAMIALFTDAITNQPRGIHRTALLPDGSGRDRTIGKMMLGGSDGAARAIKVSPDADVTMGLGIAEGIETALAVMSYGWLPVWAVGSAGAIGTFPVLAGIDELTIFADIDENRTGMREAEKCAKRWSEAGRLVTTRTPRRAKDWNEAS